MSDERQRVETVTVYCAASDDLKEEFYHCADELGRLLGECGRGLVYGGGSVGLMGRLARACRAAGGNVTGIITERLRDAELLDMDNQENIVVKTMRERKSLLEARGHAFLVLPGGVGTLEEFFEILVGRILGEHDKPIGIVNWPDPRHPDERGYYDHLIEMIDHMIEGGFARENVREAFFVCASPAEAMRKLDEFERLPPDASGRRYSALGTSQDLLKKR